jgi:hypothetical protein
MADEGAAAIPELCWPLDPACLVDIWDTFTPEVQDRAAFLAVASLRWLTGFRVGGCPITVRPCKPSCVLPAFDPSWGYAPFYPVDWNGQWSNCGCSGVCRCKAACEVTLPAPVGDLVEVKVDGAVVPLTDFRVDNGNILVYQGSDDCPFNMEQDLSKPDSEVGTWSVTYMNSYPVDALASYAAGILAVEFAKGCSGAKCRLPANVTDVIRNGVTMTITPGMFPNGFTGIREVDAFIALWKPEGSPAYSARVYSPSVPQMRHTTRSF